MVTTAKPKGTGTDTGAPLSMKPSEVTAALAGMASTRRKRALFIWGQPGISKSAIAQMVARVRGIAFVDIRLSQMDPTDLRGIPFPVQQGGIHGVQWSAPLVLPRDLDQEAVTEIDAVETTVHFYNPTGSNGIHYCTNPIIEVKALDESLTAEIVPQVRFPQTAKDFGDMGERNCDLIHKALNEPVSGFETLNLQEKRESLGPFLFTDDGVPVTERPVTLDRFVVVLRDRAGKSQVGKVKYTITGTARALVALEEFNSAPPSVQAAAYQLILDKRLGEYVVPKGCYLVAMGNRDTDKGITFKMPTPIMNRFIHIEMRHDADDWLEWAIGAGVHEHVVGFIGHFKEKLNQFNPGTAARGFPTPRSWEFVSDTVSELEDQLPEDVLALLIVGAVGEAAGVEFMHHRSIFKELPDADDILSGKITSMDARHKDDIGIAYALTTTLCYRLKDQIEDMRRKCAMQGKTLHTMKEFKPWNDSADRMLGFAIKNFPPEIAIMGAKAAMSVHKLPLHTQDMRNFEWFADKFKILILPN
jgi:hypothetical protein